MQGAVNTLLFAVLKYLSLDKFENFGLTEGKCLSRKFVAFKAHEWALFWAYC